MVHSEHLTSLHRLFTKTGYRTGLKKADHWIEDFQLAGVRNVITDVTFRHEFHGSYAKLEHNGEHSHPAVNIANR